MIFPIFKTKTENSPYFNLSDPEDRKKYFQLKAGDEIEKLKKYLEKNTFIAYLLGKKNTGKSTYSELFTEIIGPEHIAHISIGDVVREVHQNITDSKQRKDLISFLKGNYRGYISIEQCLDALLKRDTATLLPTEFILTLTKRAISKVGEKALFIDGFPRDLDQVSYSLYFRDLIGWREDPDFFILIDVPELVIDERIKHRVVCPKCHAPRNLKLHLAKKVRYDKQIGEFYFICDNSECQGEKMISKEGDKLGIETIRSRLETDQKLIKMAFSLYGIPKILLRNSIPVKEADKYVNDYEITPEYSYQWNEESKKVKVIEMPWQVLDDRGTPSYSLLPPPVVVSLIKQMVEILHST